VRVWLWVTLVGSDQTILYESVVVGSVALRVCGPCAWCLRAGVDRRVVILDFSQSVSKVFEMYSIMRCPPHPNPPACVLRLRGAHMQRTRRRRPANARAV
jgi:hypothetical protein